MNAVTRAEAIRTRIDFERIRAYIVGFGLVGAVVAPFFWERGKDSFPISSYPMFARPRPKTVVSFADAIDASGRAQRLSPEFVANDEVMQAAHIVRNAIEAGPERLAALCGRAAQRVAADPLLSSLVKVRLVQARFDSVGYFVRANEPEACTVFYECPVPR
ncbi:MAG TPA: hypothetical protein VFQ35_02740 [Polyangiaceae bacterium]|nr:hypothetical protein [Polyangiaceae bacterium]